MKKPSIANSIASTFQIADGITEKASEFLMKFAAHTSASYFVRWKNVFVLSINVILMDKKADANILRRNRKYCNDSSLPFYRAVVICRNHKFLAKVV